MSKIRAAKGVLKTFTWMAKEDWDQMDHKLARIAFGAISFVLMGLFWFYFLRQITPF